MSPWQWASGFTSITLQLISRMLSKHIKPGCFLRGRSPPFLSHEAQRPSTTIRKVQGVVCRTAWAIHLNIDFTIRNSQQWWNTALIIDIVHCVLLSNTGILARNSRYRSWIVEVRLHSINMNQEDGFFLRRSCKPLRATVCVRPGKFFLP